LIQVTVDHAAGRIPVIAGAGAAVPGVEPCRTARKTATRTRLPIMEMARKLDRIMSGMVTRSEGVLDIAAERITLRQDLPEVARFEVRNSDLDVNGHVNNTRYAQWVTDTMTTDELARFAIDEYEVNFLAETGVGDTVIIESEAGTPDAAGSLCFGRAASGGRRLARCPG